MIGVVAFLLRLLDVQFKARQNRGPASDDVFGSAQKISKHG
jgi:hypothetical protein